MKKLVLYRVEFYIKKFGEHHYFYYLYAQNAKQARQITELEWYSNHVSHMFRINVSRDLDCPFSYFTRTFYRVREY